MPFCPNCHGEFREGFTKCVECNVDLVASLDLVKPKMDELSMQEYLQDKELAVVATAELDRLKPLKNLLCSHSIANMIISSDGSCSSGGCCGGPKLELVINAEEVERAVKVIETEFKHSVDVESDSGERCERMLDLEAESLVCPACDANIPGGQTECPECGLYVGVPEDF